MTAPVEFKCFCIRQLSPFLGTLHVIETTNAQAVTDDGENWRIQVRTTIANPMGTAGTPRKRSRRTVLVGFWSSANGLHRLPGNPLIDVGEVEREVQQIITGLELHRHALPFPADDNYELWLLDKQTQKPLVLTGGSRSEDALPLSAAVTWRATAISDLGFVSPSMIRSQKDNAPLQGHQFRDRLQEIVRKRSAGAQWFKREPDGSGIGLEENRHIEALHHRHLPTEAFPPLLLEEFWEDAASQELVADYIAWQAPVLLTLAGLSDATHRRLQELARKSALGIHKHYHLYPQPLDEAVLKSALVEVRLRQAD